MYKAGVLVTCAMIGAASGASFGAGTLEFIGDGIGITDMSRDGRVIVGNTVSDYAYETWRWVQGDPNGWQRLGRATVPVLGSGAGSPDVSYDGTRVSATILGGGTSNSREEYYQTSGIWKLGGGWTELFPPLPPDCILLDSGYSSAWGLSGDGLSLTGFYWRDNQNHLYGSARPCISSIAGGTVALPTAPGSSARVNASNYDGTVVAGWEENTTGEWRPTVWRNGVKMLLADTPVLCAAEAVSADGNVIVGSTYNFQAARVNPARWVWNGSSYTMTDLGVLPGTPQTWIAHVYAESVTDDGSMIVGTNRFQNNGPYSLAKGFVWTQATGIRDVVTVMAENGVVFPSNLMIVALEISPDGSAIGGMCLNTSEPNFLDWKSFVFRFTPLSPCAGDVNGDGLTNASDFNVVASNFGSGPGRAREAGDLSGDGFVSIADFNILAGSFGCGTPND